jgi:hypothetical protein
MGFGYVWGRLANKNFSANQFTPRKINKVFKKKVWIQKIACGGFHYMVLVDNLCSQLLKIFSLVCKSVFSQHKPAFLLQIFPKLTSETMKYVQDRSIDIINSSKIFFKSQKILS